MAHSAQTDWSCLLQMSTRTSFKIQHFPVNGQHAEYSLNLYSVGNKITWTCIVNVITLCEIYVVI